MNKRLITILLFAFMIVKNPVNWAEINTAYAESQKSPEVNALSEVDIAKNINSLYKKQIVLTTEEKAQVQLAVYREQIELEKAKAKAEEEARMAKENAARINLLNTAGLSAQFINNYSMAEKIYGVPWQITAAVHYVETHQSGSTLVTSYAGAQGPMQFMPSTWRSFAQDGNGDGMALINNVDDAIYTGANYLAVNGASKGNVVSALYRYNHDMGYVNHVLSIAKTIGYNK